MEVVVAQCNFWKIGPTLIRLSLLYFIAVDLVTVVARTKE